jgi:hypothetical protein
MADAIPIADPALLAAQAKAGQAGVDAYHSAIASLQQQRQGAVQTAMQEAALRGSPAGAMQSQQSIMSAPYDSRIASLTENQGAYEASIAARDRRMADYNAAVQGARSYIPEQVRLAVAPINAQADYQVRQTQIRGEQTVAGINAETELMLAKMAAALQAAQIAAAKKAAADAAKAAKEKAPTAVQLRSELVEGARAAVGQAHEQAVALTRQTGEQNRLAASYTGQSAQYANRVKAEQAAAQRNWPANPNALNNEMLRQAASYAGQSAQYAAMNAPKGQTAPVAQVRAAAQPPSAPRGAPLGGTDNPNNWPLDPETGMPQPPAGARPSGPGPSNPNNWLLDPMTGMPVDPMTGLSADQSLERLLATITGGNRAATDYGAQLAAGVAKQTLPRPRRTATTDETSMPSEAARQMALNIAPGYREGMFTQPQRAWVSNLGLGTGANLFNAPPLPGQTGQTRPIFGVEDIDEILGGALNRDTGQPNTAASDSFRQAMILAAGKLQEAGMPITDAAITGAIDSSISGVYKPGDTLFDIQSRMAGGKGVVEDTAAAIKAATAAAATGAKQDVAAEEEGYDAVRSEFYAKTGHELPDNDPVIGMQMANLYADAGFQDALNELRNRIVTSPPTKSAELDALITAVLTEGGIPPEQQAPWRAMLEMLVS